MKGHRLSTLVGGALLSIALFGLLSGGTVRGAAPKAAAMLYCQPGIYVDSSAGMAVRVADISSGPTIAVGAPCAESVATLLNAGFVINAVNMTYPWDWTYSFIK